MLNDKLDKLGELLLQAGKKLDALTNEEKKKKYDSLQKRLFGFANFIEANLSLLYIKKDNRFECDTANIIKECLKKKKRIALPIFDIEKSKVEKIIRIDGIENQDRLNIGIKPRLDYKQCKEIKLQDINIAIIPAFIFDKKGNRAGYYNGIYNKLISNLPVHIRKVGIAFEEQVVTLLPKISGKKKIDIIITDKRIIYKI